MVVRTELEAARRKLTEQVMGKPGVTGTAVGELAGQPCLMIYVADENAGRGLPGAVGSFPVVVEVTGRFRVL